ncbi:MAG: hypothetical protein AB7K04_12735 [Pseudorhodoplanes sp.]
MKFGELKSIGHNIADSLASGIGLMIGVYQMDVFGEAAASPEGYIEVDFLTGAASGGKPSSALARAFCLHAQALPDLCKRHGVEASDFRQLTARFSMTWLVRRFVVTVEDQEGRVSTDHYEGVPGKRPKVLDHLGRIRKT